jgi:hypothetical protein
MKYLKLFEDYENKLTKEMIVNLFVTSLEGGSNYWYYIKDIPNEVRNIQKTKNLALSEAIGEFVLIGGKIYIYDIEDEDELLGYINMDKLLDAINVMKEKYPSNYENIITESDDADDADIFLQIATMGEVVFG